MKPKASTPQLDRTNAAVKTYPISPAPQAEYKIEISKEADLPAWDQFVEARPDGHHVQTSLWAQVKAGRGGRGVRIVASRKGQIVAGVQILISSLPLLGRIGYAPRGPLFAVGDPHLAQTLIEQMRQVAKAHRLRYLVVHPHSPDQIFSQRLQANGFQPSLAEIAPPATVQIDLAPSPDEILAKMNKTSRRYIRRGLREGLTLREGTEVDIPTFHRFYQMGSQRVGFTPFPESYFAHMWRTLHPHRHMHLLLVEYGGEPLATQVVVTFGNKATAKMAGWSTEHSQLRPNRMMDWLTIEWAKSQGYLYYDLEGLKRNVAEDFLATKQPPDPQIHGADHYKLGFGGRVLIFSEAYAYMANPALSWLHGTFANRVKNEPFAEKLLSRLRTA